MPWEVQVISENVKKPPIEIYMWETIVDVDKFIGWALDSLNRACRDKNNGVESRDSSSSKETIRRLCLCGVEVKLVDIPAPEG